MKWMLRGNRVLGCLRAVKRSTARSKSREERPVSGGEEREYCGLSAIS